MLNQAAVFVLHAPGADCLAIADLEGTTGAAVTTLVPTPSTVVPFTAAKVYLEDTL